MAKTRTYSIQKEDKWLFEKLKERQIKTIHDFFKSYSKIPTYYQFERQYDKYKRIQLLYSISYSISYANEIQMNIIAEKGLSDAHLFKKSIALQEISALKIEGFKVNSKLIFDKFYIDFVRGIMKVKIKNGKVEFLESIPPNYIQKKMMNTIKNMGNGTYALGYEYSKIMGEEDIFIIFYK